MKRRIAQYFIISGILANLLIISVLIYVQFVMDEPPGFLLERGVNRYAETSYGIRKRLARLVINSGLVNDWSAVPHPLRKSFPPLEQWSGQGASPEAAYGPQAYTAEGVPVGAQPSSAPSTPDNEIPVSNSSTLLKAIRSAKPGDTIVLKPGTYRINGRSIPLVRGGLPGAPITIKALKLGQVKLEMNTLEGFHVLSPFWAFENLDIRGVCASDSRCEHAFHVVGKGRAFVLRNSRLADFNAPLKVNGAKIKGRWHYPDHGLVEYNSFVNSRSRNTSNPVTLLNIDNVNGWIVRGNLIADFSKTRSDRVSYGAFMKGNGRDGVFERNLVICEMNLPPDRGIRIGLSFGGGGTAKRFCRNQDCQVEFSNGIMRNNVILNCSRDVGIYLNRARYSAIYNNLLYDTLGIDVRFPTSSASIVNNLISGRVRERDGGLALPENNRIFRGCLKSGLSITGCPLEHWFADIGAADLSPGPDFSISGLLGSGISIDGLTDDFCGSPRSPPFDLGPIQYSADRRCTPNRRLSR